MKITLTGNPKSTNHIYKYSSRGGFARSYMSADGKALKEAYQWEAKAQWHNKCLTSELELSVVLFFGDKRVRDVDNYNKLVLDALSGIVWEDDRQIQKLTVEKKYDKENPRVELSIVQIIVLAANGG